MSRYIFDINQPAGLLNPDGGESGGSLLYGLNNNFDELYKGTGNIYSIQTEDEIGSASWWETKLLSFTTFSIINNFDFGGETLALPQGVVLIFNGGIWSNGTIIGNNTSMGSYGIRQCFEIDLTLSGIWLIDYITPQHYGAICNENTSLTTNDATASIQKALDSGFNVLIPNGFYYIANSLIITKSCNVIASESKKPFSEEVISTIDHVRIYTDQNKPIIIIRYDCFVWRGGILDIRNADSYNTGVIKFDINYSYSHVDIKTVIHASGTKLLAGGGYIPRGIYFACDEATEAHEIHEINLDINCYYLRIGNYISPLNGVIQSLVSIGNFIINSWGCKQAQYLDGGGICGVFKVDGWHESTRNLSYAESISLPVIYSNARETTLSGRFYDYIDAPPAYANAVYIFNEGIASGFVDKIFDNYSYNSHKYINISARSETTISPIITSLESHGLISQIHNDFAYLVKKNPDVTVKGYDGTGIDFSAEMEPLIICPPDIGMEFTKENFFNYMTQCLVGGLASTTDFVEIVIPLSIGINYLNKLFYVITIADSQPIYIQTILRDNNLVDHVSMINYDGRSLVQPFSFEELGDLFEIGLQRVIIRFIGLIDNGAYEISDMFGKYTSHSTVEDAGLINVGGGQTIYGNLAVNDGVKEVDLPVYADNAAAKVGGLVAGDPYRTSTGIRMVVYD